MCEERGPAAFPGPVFGRCRVMRRAEVDTLEATFDECASNGGGDGFAQGGTAQGAGGRGAVERDAGQHQPGRVGGEHAGKCASADAFTSEFVCTIKAWWWWVLSASTVFRVLVVNKAWKRNRSKRVPCPAVTVLFKVAIHVTAAILRSATNSIGNERALTQREPTRLALA